MSVKRIYIGGLTPDIKLDDILGRFTPFGEVRACDIVRGKSITSDPSHCRGFAYVSFTPKDAAALSRVFSLYNGCKWRGQKLRVELAKPDFLTKLQTEWQEEQRQAEQQATSTTQEQQQHTVQEADGNETEAERNKATIRITMPGRRKSVVVDLTAKAKSYRAWFPAHKAKRVADLSWDPLPPSKKVALQAAAEAAPKPAAAAAAAAATAVVSEQEQQQRHAAEPIKGAAVPYRYKEQQQQQQPSKGMKAQVDAEHWSQLKLLKRIAEQEKAAALQQQQLEQVQQRSTAAADGQASKPGANPTKPLPKQQQQQQQHVKQVADVTAGVVVMSDDDDADADGGAKAFGVDAASLAQQLSKFDDSDSEDYAAAGQALLVPGRPQQSAQAATAAAAAAVGHAAHDNMKQHWPPLGSKQLQQQQQEEDDEKEFDAVSDGEAAAAATSAEELSDSSDGAELEATAAAAAPSAEQELLRQAHSTDSGQQDTGRSNSSEHDPEGSEEPEPQYKARHAPAAPAQPQPQAGRPQQQQQHSRRQAAVTPQAAEQHEASTATGSPGESSEEGDGLDSLEVDNEGEQQQQQQQLDILRSEQHKVQQQLGSPSAASNGAAGQRMQLLSKKPKPQQQQHGLQPHKQQQQQQVLVQPLPVVSFVEPSEVAQVESAVAAALDRFGSDSEEVLMDVDDEDTPPAAAAAAAAATSAKPKAGRAKQEGRKARPAVGGSSSSKDRGDELLCPVVPRAGTGRAAVVSLTGKQQRRQHQLGAQLGSVSKLQQKPPPRTPGAGQNKRHSR